MSSSIDADKLTSICGLHESGFGGFLTINELNSKKSVDIPNESGVYLIVRDCEAYPSFLDVGTGGRFKGKDPNVSRSILESRWIEDTLIVYIGCSGNLRRRTGQLIRFGTGSPVGHWGGRLIWQLKDSKQLRVCWKMVRGDKPAVVKGKLLETFSTIHGGRLPFANYRF